jgi:7,8-dihydropterin-6-yl-methyl-4-(beta-D-ribofuranosyl)aminobenzene 5'-phosphate synthase
MSALTVILSPVNHAAALSWINCCQQRRCQHFPRILWEKPAAAGMSSAAARRTAKAAARDEHLSADSGSEPRDMDRIIILCENTAIPAKGILGEHGFAALIETTAGRYLFDTGQGNTLLHNAAALGLDLARLNKIMLSHGHFDHTGGLAQVLGRTGPIDVHAHPDIFLKRFALIKARRTNMLKPAHNPASAGQLKRLGARLVFNTAFTQIDRNLYLTGEVPRSSAFEKPDSRLVIKKEGKIVPDPLKDDQSAILKTKKGLVVIFGCAHAGIINTLQHIRQYLPNEKMYMILGGTHLGFSSDVQVAESIACLRGFAIEKIGVSHCTGAKASLQLMNAFGEKFFFANAGSSINI